MAKKKAPNSKKKSSAKKKQAAKPSNNVGFGILLFVAVSSVVIYGLYETGKFASNPKIVSTTSNKSSKNQAQKDTKQPANKTKTQKSKFDEKDVNSTDGLKESTDTNENLPNYSNANAYYYTSSFDFGWPAYDQNDAIIEHQYFTLAYNEKTEQAKWVAYTLTKQNLDNAQFKRKDDFREDPDVSSKSASLKDYKGSGYDRGHLAPAADFTWSKEALSETFFMSNMSPQEPSFNRGIWKKLEEKVRNWAKSNHKIYVVTGPITKSISKKIGDNKVSVPSHYFKAILDIQEPEIKAIGFILKNKKSSNEIMSFAVSIDDLEKQTGLDFFPIIPDDLEVEIESTLDKGLWK